MNLQGVFRLAFWPSPPPPKKNQASLSACLHPSSSGSCSRTMCCIPSMTGCRDSYSHWSWQEACCDTCWIFQLHSMILLTSDQLKTCSQGEFCLVLHWQVCSTFKHKSEDVLFISLAFTVGKSAQPSLSLCSLPPSLSPPPPSPTLFPKKTNARELRWKICLKQQTCEIRLEVYILTQSIQ